MQTKEKVCHFKLTLRFSGLWKTVLKWVKWDKIKLSDCSEKNEFNLRHLNQEYRTSFQRWRWQHHTGGLFWRKILYKHWELFFFQILQPYLKSKDLIFKVLKLGLVGSCSTFTAQTHIRAGLSVDKSNVKLLEQLSQSSDIKSNDKFVGYDLILRLW